MVQAAAMRRVEGADALALALQRASGEPRISATLGTVAVQDVMGDVVLQLGVRIEEGPAQL